MYCILQIDEHWLLQIVILLLVFFFFFCAVFDLNFWQEIKPFKSLAVSFDWFDLLYLTETASRLLKSLKADPHRE